MVRPRSAPPRGAGGDRARGIGEPRGRAPRLHAVGRQPAAAGARADRRRDARDPLARRALGRADRGRHASCSRTPTRSRATSSRRAPTSPRSADGRTGELRIGAVPSVAAALVPALAAGAARARAAADARRERVVLPRASCSTASPPASSTSSSRRRTSRARDSSPRRSCATPTSCSCRPATRSTQLGRKLTPADLAAARPDRQGLRHGQPARAQRRARGLRPRRPAHPRARPARGAGARAPRARRRGRAEAAAGRARSDDRDAPRRPLRARPPHRADDARRTARARPRRVRAPRSSAALAVVPRQMFSGCHACQRSTSIHAL